MGRGVKTQSVNGGHAQGTCVLTLSCPGTELRDEGHKGELLAACFLKSRLEHLHLHVTRLENSSDGVIDTYRSDTNSGFSPTRGSKGVDHHGFKSICHAL